MARVPIDTNFNDSDINAKCNALHVIPLTDGNLTGDPGSHALNGAEVTSDNFDGAGSVTLAGPVGTKLYGEAAIADEGEAKFLRRRLLGLC
jgi:hypothetical protein